VKKTLTMLSALLLGAAFYNASAGIIITLDENGNGTWNNNGTITSLTYGSAAPSDPVGPATLYYNLPSGYNNYTYVSGVQLPLSGKGDLLMTEPSTTDLSDVIRFDGLIRQPRIYFYSDRSPGDPSDSLADVNGLPTTFASVTATVAETGPEDGLNGYWGYHPTGDQQPGTIWDGSGVLQDVTYNFISDVPEPGTFALMVCGLTGLLVMRRRSA
jgi:hypothetical protein